MIVSQSLDAMSNTLRRDIYDLLDPGRSIEQVNYPDQIKILSLEFGMLVFIGSTISARLIVICTIKLAYAITG